MARLSKRPATNRIVLVVDDQEETLDSVRSLLEREGHRVLTASSGPDALAILKETDVDVMVVDYFMPRMTGGELVERLRSFDSFVQIILHTGYSGEKPPRQMLADLDIQGYHDKGDDPDRLLLWVDVALKARRLIERLRERERLQGELVANCSHEFRTPLNVMGGYLELLQSGDFGLLPAAALAPLATVRRATRALSELVDDFLSYAKLEARVYDVTKASIEVSELAQEMDRLGNVLVNGEKVRFTVDGSRAPERVVSDPVKLRTILRNLVGNAAKFTVAGAIVVTIDTDGDAVRFRVSDTGCGIAAEDLETIFEPFRQGDGSMTSRYGGVGLGLALSRKMAGLLNGDLQAESTLGAGSTFTLRVPSAAAAAGTGARPAA